MASRSLRASRAVSRLITRAVMLSPLLSRCQLNRIILSQLHRSKAPRIRLIIFSLQLYHQQSLRPPLAHKLHNMANLSLALRKLKGHQLPIHLLCPRKQIHSRHKQPELAPIYTPPIKRWPIAKDCITRQQIFFVRQLLFLPTISGRIQPKMPQQSFLVYQLALVVL